jgi:hypothetical protein
MAREYHLGGRRQEDFDERKLPDSCTGAGMRAYLEGLWAKRNPSRGFPAGWRRASSLSGGVPGDTATQRWARLACGASAILQTALLFIGAHEDSCNRYAA